MSIIEILDKIEADKYVGGSLLLLNPGEVLI